MNRIFLTIILIASLFFWNTNSAFSQRSNKASELDYKHSIGINIASLFNFNNTSMDVIYRPRIGKNWHLRIRGLYEVDQTISDESLQVLEKNFNLLNDYYGENLNLSVNIGFDRSIIQNEKTILYTGLSFGYQYRDYTTVYSYGGPITEGQWIIDQITLNRINTKSFNNRVILGCRYIINKSFSLSFETGLVLSISKERSDEYNVLEDIYQEAEYNPMTANMLFGDLTSLNFEIRF